MKRTWQNMAGVVIIGILHMTTILHGQQDDGIMKNAMDQSGLEPQAIVAVGDVCAWPNLTLLPDGVIIATIHNQPSHLHAPADIECWASEDNGDFIVITTGWSDPVDPGRGEITPTWVSRSTDGGFTWHIDKDLFPAGPDNLPVVPFGDILPGHDGHLRLAAARYDGLKLYFSDDDAHTWLLQSVITDSQQHPGHLMRMNDGSILLTFGNRQNPKGIIQQGLFIILL